MYALYAYVFIELVIKGAVQRHVCLRKQAVKEIIDGPDRVYRIQVVAVDSGNLRPHA
jgi:hypothetical protein